MPKMNAIDPIEFVGDAAVTTRSGRTTEILTVVDDDSTDMTGKDNESITSYYINDGDQTCTFAGGTGVTVADTGNTVLINEAAVLVWRRTSSTAVTLYIVSS